MHVIGRKENVYKRKYRSSTPTGLVWNTNMAAVSLFWNTNMKAVTSCENAHVEGTRAVPGKVRQRVVCRQFNAE